MTHQVPATQALSEAMVQNEETVQFVGFQLNEQDYAFRIEQIQEIVILTQITRVPQVSEYVDGVSNLRGTIIPIINLRRLFGIDPKPTDDQTRTIVVNVGDRTMGCTVDSVSHVMRIPVKNIQAAPEIVTSAGTAYIRGFTKLAEKLIILLDIDELLEPAKLDAVYREVQQGAVLPYLANDISATS